MLSVCQATPISPAGPAADSPDNPTFCSLCLSATLASDAGFHVFPRPAGKRAQPPPEREQPLPAGPAGLRRASTEPAKDPGAGERCHRAACPPAAPATRQHRGAEEPLAPLALLRGSAETQPSPKHRDHRSCPVPAAKPELQLGPCLHRATRLSMGAQQLYFFISCFLLLFVFLNTVCLLPLFT